MEKKGIDLDKVMKSRTVYELDASFTAKINGFKSAEEYYDNSRGDAYLRNVKIPVLALNSMDDPVIHSDVIPFKDFENYENIILATTTTGGHLGWYKGIFIPTSWFQVPCLEFLDACLSHKNN